MESTDNKAVNHSLHKLIKIVLVLLVLMSASAYYFYSQTRVLQQGPSVLSEEQIVALVERVERIISLPQGEVPTIATVSDIEPLAENPFFANAKVGDQVLLYTAARRAYLYDPDANIIIEVALLNIGQ